MERTLDHWLRLEGGSSRELREILPHPDRRLLGEREELPGRGLDPDRRLEDGGHAPQAAEERYEVVIVASRMSPPAATLPWSAVTIKSRPTLLPFAIEVRRSGVRKGQGHDYPAGTGIQGMKDAMVEADLKEPEFETDGFFRVVFRRSPEFALKQPKEAGDKLIDYHSK